MEIDYKKLVEELEEVEDSVECKNCFDVQPKSICFKTHLGWLCPVCYHELTAHEGNTLDLVDANPDTLGYDDPRLPEKEEEPEVLEEPITDMREHEKLIKVDLVEEAAVDTADDADEELIPCDWCGELTCPSDLRRELDLGFICPTCVAAIKSRGEELVFIE